MVMRSSGEITFTALREEFGQHVTSLSQLYYSRAPAADQEKHLGCTDDTLPSTGEISFSHFYGKGYKYLELYESSAAYTYTYVAGYSLCFPPGAKVNTPDGYRNIEDLKIGDDVLSVNYRTDVPFYDVKKVEKILTHTYDRTKNNEIILKVTPSVGEPFYVTHNHPVMIGHNKENYEVSFNPIGNLVAGDVIINKDLQEVIIEKIEPTDCDAETLYNLEIQDFNTYMVNDFVVHNGGGCFPEGTKVSTPYGEVDIETLKRGDYVMAVDYSQLVPSEPRVRRITNVSKHVVAEIIGVSNMVKIFHEGGELVCTDNHGIMVDAKSEDPESCFTEAGKLKTGDKLYHNGNRVTVLDVVKVDHAKYTNVYNFDVEEDHTYIANGVIVHNGSYSYTSKKSTYSAYYASAYVPASYSYRVSIWDLIIR